jgi:hypothetical protein
VLKLRVPRGRHRLVATFTGADGVAHKTRLPV